MARNRAGIHGYWCVLPAVLVAATAAAEPGNEVIVDAAVEGGGKEITKAYFVGGDYFVRYDWGRDRVEAGPQPLNALPFMAPFARGIDAGHAGFGGVEGLGMVYRGSQRVVYDAASGGGGQPEPLLSMFPPEFRTGIDAAIHGLGTFAGFTYFYKGGQYIKFHEAQSKVVDGGPKPIAAQRFPATFTRIDAAVNGAGSFVGKGYFFRGDEYVRFNWMQGIPETAPQKTVAKFPGLIEMLQAGRAVSTGVPWCVKATAAVDDAVRGTPSAATLAALATHFKIRTAAERAQLVGVINARMMTACMTLAEPGSTVRFRTRTEAQADLGLGPQGVAPVLYAAPGLGISVTTPFLEKSPGCRAALLFTALFEVQGVRRVATAPTTAAEAVADPTRYGPFARQIAGVAESSVCAAP